MTARNTPRVIDFSDTNASGIVTPEGELSVEEAIARQPPEKRARLLAGIRAAERERNEERKWVAGQLRDTLNTPGIVYKYMPASPRW